MTTLEQKIIGRIEKHRDICFFLIITFLAILIRLCGKDFMSKDMMIFLLPWFDSIKEQGGLQGLSIQVGDYNILYQTIIALFSYLNMEPIFLYKIFSCTFDFLLAYHSALLICECTHKPKYKYTFNCAYALILFFPTVIFNSAFWGQCDAIYVFFCILTLKYIYHEKYILSFIFLGMAFAFKLQTIFIVPFIVVFYFYKKNFSILYFLISAFVLELSGITGFFAGRSLTAPWDIYLYQTQEQPVMYANIPNFWVLVGDNYDFLSKFAIIFTICILGCGLYLVISGRKPLDNPKNFFDFACWNVWTCISFLPVMHERYTYGLDILLLILCFINRKYLPLLFISGILSLLSYSYFLFDTPYAEKPAALIFLLAYLYYTCVTISASRQQIMPQN